MNAKQQPQPQTQTTQPHDHSSKASIPPVKWMTSARAVQTHMGGSPTISGPSPAVPPVKWAKPGQAVPVPPVKGMQPDGAATVHPGHASFRVRPRSSEQFIQRAARSLPEISGIEGHMAHGEALGNTGGQQTTVLEAKINGVYIGKFDNREQFMGKGKVITPATIDAHFPGKICKPYWQMKTGAHDSGHPHAEDYLFAALAYEYHKLGGRWQDAYPRHPSQTFDLLSIKMDKTSCPNCARNLLKLSGAYGLEVREKASYLHTGVSPKTSRTGAEILDQGKKEYGNTGVPVRHWTVAKLENYIGNKLGKTITESPSVETFRGKNIADTDKFPLAGEAEKDWSAMGFGRKSGTNRW